ncbi:MAG TPA: D-alanine aminotransferase Dat [bacterium]|nr:D-alanine aminotransferase Dat [bacterium]
MIGYFNGEFVPESEIKISPFDRGFLFADGVYEVIRYYHDHFFLTDEHLRRMRHGLQQLRITPPDLEEFKIIIQRLIQANNLHDLDVLAYIQVTRGVRKPRTHFFPTEKTAPTVLILTSVFQRHQQEIDNGVKVILQPDTRWRCCDIKSIALLPNVLARQNAVDANAAEAVFVRDGMITEGTHTNFCAVKNGTMWTPPLSNFILAGVTRNLVLDICRKLSISVREDVIKERELETFDEHFLVGTTVEITPIIQIDDRKIAEGKPGAITRAIQTDFFESIKRHPEI